MSRVRRAGLTSVLSLALLCASVGMVSGKGNSYQLNQPHQITQSQEVAVVGGSDVDPCSFLHGFAWGLGFAGLFGCLPCEAAALGIELGVIIACS